MKHASQLQQLHQLLSSEQPGPADSQGFTLKETNKAFGSLDLDDSSSSGVSSERDLSNSGRQPSRSHSDSATSRDLSPDHSDVYLCSGSGCSVRSDSSSVSLHDVPSHHIIPHTSYKYMPTTTQPTNTHGDLADSSRVANFSANYSSNFKNAFITNGSVKSDRQNNTDKLGHEGEWRNYLPDGNLSGAWHDPGTEWTSEDLLSEISRDAGTCVSLDCQTIRDLHDCSAETREVSEESTHREDIPDSQSLVSRIRRQRQMEIEQVHQVYRQIAPHCGHVKQKAWPRVKQFLKELEPGSLVADVGCGNGRYLMINSSTFKLGCDLCQPFLDQARGKGHEVMIADNLALPFRDGMFDAVISIGVIHHFASLQRRIMAIAELSRILSPGGKLMVYVWAFEQVHRKFEGQDVLIPWVKPEVTGNAPRKSLSVSSEPETERHSFRCGSRSVDNTDVSAPGRPKRPACFNRLGSAGEKYRSKSLGDEETARDVCRDLSIGSGYFGSQTLVEFYQRVSKTREFRGAKHYSIRKKNAVSSDKSNHECQNGEEGEDRKVSKWPGQLVSECRKLGKFLRSLSSRSNSLGDGEGDQIGFGGTVPDVHSNYQPHCNANKYSDMATKSTEDACDTSTCGILTAESYNAKNINNVKVTQFEQLTHTQDKNNCCCDPAVPIPSSCAVSCSDLSLPSVASSGPCQVYNNNNTAIRMTSDDIADHNIPSTSGASKHTTDSKHMPTEFRIKDVESVSSLETTSTVSHEENPVETIANESAGTQLTLIKEKCLEENKVDLFNDHTHSLCDTDVEAPSQSWMTVTNSDSFNSEDSLSSQSDTTIMDSQVSVDTNIPTQRSENLQQLLSTQDESVCYGESPKEPSGSLTETPTYVPRGIIDDGVNIQELNRCLPKCQNKCHAMISEHPHVDQKGLVEGTDNPRPSRSNDTGKAMEGLSEMSVYLDSCNVVSLDRTKPVESSTVQYNVLDAISESHTAQYNNSSLDRGYGDEGDADINIDKPKICASERDKMMFPATQRTAKINERQNMRDTTLQQEVVPFRGTLKTFLNKLADYFRPHSKHGSNKFGCYPNGKSAARRYLVDSDSSDIEISLSSFSSHSSCYPGLFAISKERDSCEKTDHISEVDPCNHDTGHYHDAFEIIDDIQTQVDDNRSNTDKITDKLNISVFNNKENCRQDFVNDVSEMVVEYTQDKAKNALDDPYVFKVENISQVPLRKASFFNNLSRKWSGLFDKRSGAGSRKPYIHYSTASASSSSDDNKERLKISLKDSKALNLSQDLPQKRTLIRRPNSLDFSKKRTRRCGRRPAPRKDNTVTRDNKDVDGRNRVRKFQENQQLSLSDAMTLLGDGVAEESIVKRLDKSAKCIFAEMKRIDFAMRKFPMSSLDNGNKEAIPQEAANAENSTEEMTNSIHRTLKMRRSKNIFSAHRGFSESITAQDTTKNRRQHFQGFKDVHGIDLTKVPCLDKKCVSEDFQISFDGVGGQICKSKCQILYSCNSDSKPELQLSSQNQLVSFQNRTNNAHIAPEDPVSAAPYENAQEGTTSAPRSVKESLGVATADKESNFPSKYGTRANHHSAEILAAKSFHMSQESNKMVHRLDERTQVVNVLSKDGSSSKEKDVKLTSRSSSIDNTQPTRATTHILKHKPTRRSNKPRTLYNEQAAESNTDNSLSRYYHVFKKGELDHLVTSYVPSLTIVETFYDHANWCIIAEKLSVP